MTATKRLLLRCVTGLAVVVVVGTTGCQTYTGGMTLPSPHYLRHFPQYFPPDPPFQLQREKDSMLDPTGQIRGGAGGAVAPIGPPPAGVKPPEPIMPK